MSATRKKIAVLIEDLYQVLEVWYPYYRLREAGFETMFVGPTETTYKSKEGYPAKAERAIDKIKTEELSGVVIPGGYAPDMLRRSDKIVKLVTDLFEANKMVASICHGGWVLASACILKGRKATSFSAIKDDMINAGAEYLDEEVVVDGNLITSRKPDDLPAFCREIIKYLNMEG